MKKVILVNASPREGGNCARAMELLTENMKNVEVERFDLREKDVNACKACDVCKTKDSAQCVQKDDMGALISKLDECDALVVASPVYFGMINGPAKTFLDRTYCFFQPGKPNDSLAKKAGKKAAVILTAGGGPIDDYAEHGKAFARFGVMGVEETKVLAFNSAKSGMAANIFSIEEDAEKVKELAGWLSE